MIEKTFALIKPDAVAAKHVGEIIAMIEKAGFSIVRLEQRKITEDLAKKFYLIHAEKPFFGELVNFITSGPVIAMVLEKDNAVAGWRKLMGATDPQKAETGTVRKHFGSSIGENATHGSDAAETARQEIVLFFPDVKM
jgi:nucleoside-diphosphate kinase